MLIRSRVTVVVDLKNDQARDAPVAPFVHAATTIDKQLLNIGGAVRST